MLNINRFQHNINLWAAGFSRICAGGSIYGGLKAGRMLYRARVRARNKGNYCISLYPCLFKSRRTEKSAAGINA